MLPLAGDARLEPMSKVVACYTCITMPWIALSMSRPETYISELRFISDWIGEMGSAG